MASQPDGRPGPEHIHGVVDRFFLAHSGHHEDGIAIPSVRDRVRIQGRDEVFFIIYVDLRRRVVDLVCGERVGFVSDIPFADIRPAPERLGVVPQT